MTTETETEIVTTQAHVLGDLDNLAEQLRQSLVERGVTPSELSRQIRISTAASSRFLRGLAGVGIESLSQICKVYHYRLVPLRPESATEAIPELSGIELLGENRKQVQDEIMQSLEKCLIDAKMQFEAPIALPDGSKVKIALQLNGVNLSRALSKS